MVQLWTRRREKVIRANVFLFDVEVMELDGSSKGRLNHRAHVGRRGDTSSDLMTFALHWRTRGVNVSSGGLIRAWAGLTHVSDLACRLNHSYPFADF